MCENEYIVLLVSIHIKYLCSGVAATKIINKNGFILLLLKKIDVENGKKVFFF